MKKRWWFLIIILLALFTLVMVAVALSRSNSSQPETIAVTYQDVIKEVSFTGRINPVREVQLGFEYAGILTQIPVQVGQEVTANQFLAFLDDQAAQLEAAQAQANEASAAEQARLAWQQAETDWSNTKSTNSRSLEAKRQTVRDAKKELEQKKELHLQSLRDYEEHSSTVKTAYAAVITAESAYHAAQESLAQAEKTVTQSNEAAYHAALLAQSKYEATQQASGSVAGISSLAAASSLAQMKLSKSVISAPFAGTVTNVTGETGEYVSPSTPVITLATLNDLEIVAKVPETDAAGLKSGQTATVTFDALPSNQTYAAEVTQVSPAAEILEGVPTYEVKLKLSQAAPEIKSGFTTNIEVGVEKRSRVLAAPRRTIHTENNESYVYVFTDSQAARRPVTTGLYGSNGLVEITSGLTENDLLVTGPETE